MSVQIYKGCVHPKRDWNNVRTPAIQSVHHRKPLICAILIMFLVISSEHRLKQKIWIFFRRDLFGLFWIVIRCYFEWTLICKMNLDHFLDFLRPIFHDILSMKTTVITDYRPKVAKRASTNKIRFKVRESIFGHARLLLFFSSIVFQN